MQSITPTSQPLKILLDANVLYPSTLRAFFIAMHRRGMIDVCWSQQIVDEWVSSIRPTLTKIKYDTLQDQILNIKQEMPTSFIMNYESHMSNLKLRDERDVHVVAAAVEGRVDYLCTFNLLDFPNSVLKKYNIKAMHPDKMILELIKTNLATVEQSLRDILTHEGFRQSTLEQIKLQLKNRGLVKAIKKLG